MEGVYSLAGEARSNFQVASAINPGVSLGN